MIKYVVSHDLRNQVGFVYWDYQFIKWTFVLPIFYYEPFEESIMLSFSLNIKQ